MSARRCRIGCSTNTNETIASASVVDMRAPVSASGPSPVRACVSQMNIGQW